MKYNHFKSVLVAVSFFQLIALTACTKKGQAEEITIEIQNKLNFSRNEVVSIQRNKLLSLLDKNDEKNIRVKLPETDKYLVTQWMDNNGDGKGDELLFQANVAANSTTKYVIMLDTVSVTIPKAKTYSRFVPERIDDYAWENNKVAFRAYGPVAQQLVEQGKEGGTLFSGIDLWLKKVDYSIIDSWYQKNVKSPGYYHIEHGEGYDPYHVGASRGTGGTGIWRNDSLQVSKNYVSYKTIATGPLRTVFELIYAPWSTYGLHEVKRISLDLDSNFSKFEITYQSDKKIPNYTVGITLHDKKGEVNINRQKGWFRHWEPMDSTFVGEGIVLSPQLIDTAFVHDSNATDQSNLLILTHPDNKITYYAGFAWTGSKQIRDVMDWDEMLNKQAKIIANPLQLIVK
ncbi:DUF4861 family protein [Flavobacterium daejeonense]|uniref:DUF4861 family protein n=1 Tax=Flavobacterium daejeonense TaxID=350893 RepID=UPI00047D0630|nr:DUF4861 family protein [Flavobacterium daejeonense]